MARRGKRLKKPAKRNVEALVALGEPEPTARVMSALFGKPAQTVDAVAKRAGYGPAAARVALGILDKRGWITTVRKAPHGRGARPILYTLSASKTTMQQHYRALAWRAVAVRFEAVRPWR